MYDPEFYPKFAMCSNPECRATVEFFVWRVTPIFCTRCKFPLFTSCLHCHLPFVYRPEKFCGVCSSEIHKDSFPRSVLLILVYKTLRDTGKRPVESFPKFDQILDSEDLIEYEKSFPWMMTDIQDIEDQLRRRGLDILLGPISKNQRSSLLKLVKKSK